MYASVWKRFFAFLIDVFIFVILFWVLAQVMDNASVSLTLLVLIWLYYALLESSPLQASVGKIIIGLKVVDKRGRRLSFWQATERILSKLITNITFYFGFFIAAFDKRKQTLHDRISHSAVIRKMDNFDPDFFEAEEEDEFPSFTFITIVSVLLALVFVGLLVFLVASPQYQKAARQVQLSRVLTTLDNAAVRQIADSQGNKPALSLWQREYENCQLKSPVKLVCDGFELILSSDGITAQARAANMDILYTLFRPFDGSPVSCTPQTALGEELCSALHP